MFTLSQILSLPVLSGLDAGAMQWPTIGAVLVSLLIAALVGTVLGLLREAAIGMQRRPGEKVAAPQCAAVADDHGYCEAA
jgi:tetrahydromethanopterin S-methyltransferase subunit C